MIWAATCARCAPCCGEQIRPPDGKGILMLCLNVALITLIHAGRWSWTLDTAAHYHKHLLAQYRWLKQEAEDHERAKETDGSGEVVYLPFVLYKALEVLENGAYFSICPCLFLLAFMVCAGCGSDGL